MIPMEPQEEIPCASCQSWNGRQKKFFCNPNLCKGLSDWMQEHTSIPNIEDHTKMRLSETTIQYVV
jgi:hypothetical protein